MPVEWGWKIEYISEWTERKSAKWRKVKRWGLLARHKMEKSCFPSEGGIQLPVKVSMTNSRIHFIVDFKSYRNHSSWLTALHQIEKFHWNFVIAHSNPIISPSSRRALQSKVKWMTHKMHRTTSIEVIVDAARRATNLFKCETRRFAGQSDDAAETLLLNRRINFMALVRRSAMLFHRQDFLNTDHRATTFTERLWLWCGLGRCYYIRRSIIKPLIDYTNTSRFRHNFVNLLNNLMTQWKKNKLIT